MFLNVSTSGCHGAIHMSFSEQNLRPDSGCLERLRPGNVVLGDVRGAEGWREDARGFVRKISFSS